MLCLETALTASTSRFFSSPLLRLSSKIFGSTSRQQNVVLRHTSQLFSAMLALPSRHPALRWHADFFLCDLAGWRREAASALAAYSAALCLQSTSERSLDTLTPCIRAVIRKSAINPGLTMVPSRCRPDSLSVWPEPACVVCTVVTLEHRLPPLLNRHQTPRPGFRSRTTLAEPSREFVSRELSNVFPSVFRRLASQRFFFTEPNHSNFAPLRHALRRRCNSLLIHSRISVRQGEI